MYNKQPINNKINSISEIFINANFLLDEINSLIDSYKV